MVMQLLLTLSNLLGSLASIPAVGKILATVVAGGAALILVVNALVAIWHSVVILLNALAAVPGLSGLGGIASSMLAEEAVISDFAKGKILPILAQISALPVPKK